MGLGKFKFRYKKYLKIGDVIIEILKKFSGWKFYK